ncbi:HpcH/HpaI aldolase family protein [Pedobacter hiemivivus]|uniref:HpcH/HpaI aldolase/citrate lyase domain-containing protein n=1 Tax=Pedobacter hiemivivus TaxID=2530454 RepID=A0A4R0NCS8_9SPHI|nr:aldolase/citrate lyase family protein [Pedobacter hiemivivus]TCC96244.1 hypothetical protein EZ444_12455 [Pedobacter hiemivivus]
MNRSDNVEVHGIWRIMPSASISEIIGQSGFQFQILDCEHGAYDFRSLQDDIRGCHLVNCKAYVRVSGLNVVEVQRCLDLGADGIVFPQLKNYSDFNTATLMVQYPPYGIRGYNPFVPAGGYGFDNIHEKEISCIGILETLSAVNDLDRILSLDKLNTIYIGVYDLSAQLGCIGVMDSPKLLKLVDEIIDKCRKSSKQVSLMINSEADYQKYKSKGATSFVHTIDSHQIKTAFKRLLSNLNQISNG